MSGLILPNGTPATPEPEDIDIGVDQYGNKIIYDPTTKSSIVFGKNGCVGFIDAHGVQMKTTPDGYIEFVAKGVRYKTEKLADPVQSTPKEN